MAGQLAFAVAEHDEHGPIEGMSRLGLVEQGSLGRR
jgi:hypothetical protein